MPKPKSKVKKVGKGKEKKNYVTYPKGVKTVEQQKEYLEDQIEETLSKIDRLNCSSVEYAKQLGLYLLEYKRLVNAKGKKGKKGKKWEKYRKEVFPALNKRTDLRYRKIAVALKKIDLKENRAIAVLGQTRLLNLIDRLSKGQTLLELLEENEIDLDIDAEDPEEVAELKADVDKISSGKSNKNDDSESESDESDNETGDTEGDDDLENTSDENTSDDDSNEDEKGGKGGKQGKSKVVTKSLKSALEKSTNEVIRTIDRILSRKGPKPKFNKKDLKEFFNKVEKLKRYLESMKK